MWPIRCQFVRHDLLPFLGGLQAIRLILTYQLCFSIRYHRMIADICHCEKSPNRHADNGLDMMASSTFSLDAYSGCSHYILKACHYIARLVGRLESHEHISYSDFAKEETHMYVSPPSQIHQTSAFQSRNSMLTCVLPIVLIPWALQL